MPVVALTNRRTFFGLYAPEVLVILFGLICWQMFAMFGVPLRHPLQLYLDRVTASLVSYPVCLMIALFLLRLAHIRHASAIVAEKKLKPAETGKDLSPLKRFLSKNNQLIPYRFTWNEFRRLYIAPKVMLFDLRMIHAMSAMFVVFINLKHLIPRVNPLLLDQSFAEIEFQIFGKLMTVWMIQKLGTGWIAELLSQGYTAWYAYVAVSCLIMVMQRNRVKTEEFSAAFILMWLLAIVAIYLAPSWGPCFYYPHQLSSYMPHTKMIELQAGLWKGREFVLANPASPKGVFLISGFPSLHFAATLLGTYFLWGVNRTCGILSAVFAVVTFFTTIYFGWHYLMDDIGAVLLVGVVLLITRRFYRTHLLFIEPQPQVIKMGSI